MENKPKRVGTYVNQWILNGRKVFPSDKHPVYEYKGYYIVRSSPVNNIKKSYYDIYTHFENNEPKVFDFDLNHDKGFRRLKDAVSTIDNHLEDSKGVKYADNER